MMADAALSRKFEAGQLIAHSLREVWRNDAPSWSLSDEELSRISLQLLKSGCGALAWWRLRNSDLAETPEAHEMSQVWRLHLLQDAMHELALEAGIAWLHTAGLEPLLGKGWAMSHLYPDPGLRPYGDFDLYVRPEQIAQVNQALKRSGAPAFNVDLHGDCLELKGRNYDEMLRRSVVLPAGQSRTAVRVFGPEDHLRLLCLHTLKHGAWRPLWVCDLAVAVEARPANFDWDYFLSGDARRRDWLIAALGLARELLGANLDETPIAKQAGRLPRWMVPTVLCEWGNPPIPHGVRVPMKDSLNNLTEFLKALRTRWPNGIEATIDLNASFNQWPRLPLQITECVARTIRFVAHSETSHD